MHVLVFSSLVVSPRPLMKRFAPTFPCDVADSRSCNRGPLKPAIVRILVVDDYEPWRRFARLALHEGSLLQVIGEASDGLEAVQRAQELQPDLILLDIGLPRVNGIEAARQIREVAPQSKILMVSENRFWDVAEEALRIGAGGYVVKVDASSELLPAVQSILQGERFLSASLGNPKKARRKSRHEVEFYPDDASLVDGFARIMKTVLEGGNEVAFFGTKSHHAGLIERFRADCLDIGTMIEGGRYNFSDVVDALPQLLGNNDLPDPDRCAQAFDDLVIKAAKKAKRVAFFGELAPFLLGAGKVEAAIRLEHLTLEYVRTHDIDIFCGYLLSAFPNAENDPTFRTICAEHLVVHRTKN